MNSIATPSGLTGNYELSLRCGHRCFSKCLICDPNFQWYLNLRQPFHNLFDFGERKGCAISVRVHSWKTGSTYSQSIIPTLPKSCSAPLLADFQSASFPFWLASAVTISNCLLKGMTQWLAVLPVYRPVWKMFLFRRLLSKWATFLFLASSFFFHN